MSKVLLKHIKKVYPGNVTAVYDADFEIKDKEFVVIVGPSGCGKSTTLRMIAGLEDISGGELYIGDTLVNNLPPKERNIAMVFQNYALYPHMSVYENMAFGLKLRKYPKDEIHTRVLEAAELLGIRSLIDRKPKQLSGGQRQRVAVGRAIVRKPQVFLFDEPLSNLDAKLRVQMRTEISKLHIRLQTTMIYVTHDQIEAMTMGDRIVVMKDGHIQQIDTPINIYNKPVNKFVAGFIGSPPMNFVEGTIIKKGDDLFFKAEEFELKFPQNKYELINAANVSDVLLGIRPEDIYDRITAPAMDDQEHRIISVNVEVIEPMGSELFVYLNSSNAQLTASMPVSSDVEVNQNIQIVINMDKTHLFDKKTEKAIF